MNGSAGAWGDFPDVCPGNYTIQWGGGAVLTVRKQYIGNFTLKSGGMVGRSQHSLQSRDRGYTHHACSKLHHEGMARMHTSAACANAVCLTGVKLRIHPIEEEHDVMHTKSQLATYVEHVEC